MAQVSGSASGAAPVPQVCPLVRDPENLPPRRPDGGETGMEGGGAVRELSAGVAPAWACDPGHLLLGRPGERPHCGQRQAEQWYRASPRTHTWMGLDKGRSCRPLAWSSPWILGGWEVRAVSRVGSLRSSEVAWSGCLASAGVTRDLTSGVCDCRSGRCSVPLGA